MTYASWLASGTPAFSGSENPVISCARIAWVTSTKAASRYNTREPIALEIISYRPRPQKQDHNATARPLYPPLCLIPLRRLWWHVPDNRPDLHIVPPPRLSTLRLQHRPQHTRCLVATRMGAGRAHHGYIRRERRVRGCCHLSGDVGWESGECGVVASRGRGLCRRGWGCWVEGVDATAVAF